MVIQSDLETAAPEEESDESISSSDEAIENSRGAATVVAEIVPSYTPSIPKPSALVNLEESLSVATNEFILALRRLEMWRALAFDQELVARLGRGFAATGFMTLRSSVFDALLLTLTRMFDKNKKSMNLARMCNELGHEEIENYLRAISIAEKLDFPRRANLDEHLGQQEFANLTQLAEAEAQAAGQSVAARFERLKRLHRSFIKCSYHKSLGRLVELRNKEVAHRDVVDLIPAADRPKYRDLDRLFAAAAVLLRLMNLLARNLDMNFLIFRNNARLHALAITGSMRDETIHERHKIRNILENSQARCRK